MLHEIDYLKDNTMHSIKSTLIVKGDDNVHTAMAKTVGLPMAIATKLILNSTITSRGLHIPVLREIYEPILSELAQNGIAFVEQ